MRAALACLLAALLPAAALAADAQRGRMLYETGCTACHDKSVHGREPRSAASFEAIRAYVWRWNQVLDGSWRRQEIDDVARYLNERYYRYPCPPDVCPERAGLPGPRLAGR